MGEVYLAHDTKLDRQVALKILPAEVAADQQRMNRFLREAKSASALNHPNIVTTYEIQETDGITFIALELIDGETLSLRIKQGLNVVDALDISIQIAGALAAAHAAGIVHRDIKPHNVMVRRDGIVKVLDFGLAKLTSVEQSAVDMEASTKFKTSAGVVLGTPVYMSPEQACGQEVDARTDIFSLGIVIYQMITGHLPFDGTNVAEVTAAILSEKQPQPLARFSREAPVELERIVSKTLRKNRDERYQTIKDLQLDLVNLKQELEFEKRLERSKAPHGSITAPNHDAGTVLTRSRRFRLRNLVLAAAILLAVVLGIATYLTRRPAVNDSITSIVVLPFVNVSNQPGAEYLSDGLAEALINSLTELDQLRVIARSTSFRYKGKDIDPQQLGRELNVQAVLTGRVRQLGDALNIQVDLIDAASGRQLWGQEYQRQNSDVLAVKQAIAQEVTDKLRLRITREQQQRLVKHDATNPDAYKYYLRGRFFWNKRTGEGMKKAIEEFNQATTIDPLFALGYVGLADTYLLLEQYAGAPATEVLPPARAAVDRALQLDESLAEAHATSGMIYDRQWRWAEAEPEYERAIALNPNYATSHHWYSLHLRHRGRIEESLREIMVAQRLDPLSPIIGNNVAVMHLLANDLNAAMGQCQRVIEIDPNYPEAHNIVSLIYLKQGRKAEAVASSEKAAELGGRSAFHLSWLAYTYARADRRADALRLMKEVEEQYARGKALGQYLAGASVGLSDKDRAFYWLDKDVKNRSGQLPFVAWFPYIFDDLHDDPRFADLIRRMNLPVRYPKQ